MTLPKLPDSIASPQDLTALLLELREYARWYEHEMVKRKSGVKDQSVQPILSPETVTFIRSINDKEAMKPEQLDALLEELEAYKLRAPTATITLAAPAPTGLKKELAAWCRAELAADILIEFAYNRTLLGGMVIRYNSHVFDWSFRRQLTDSTLSFSEVLERV